MAYVAFPLLLGFPLSPLTYHPLLFSPFPRLTGLLPLEQSCTRFLHACNALCNVQIGLTNLHPPPYRSRQIIYFSHSESVPLPLRNSRGQSLIATCRAVPLHPYALASRQIMSLSHAGPCRCITARVQAELHTSSHTVPCARLVHLCSRAFRAGCSWTRVLFAVLSTYFGSKLIFVLVKDVQTKPGADIDSDHNLLVAKICTILKRIIRLQKKKPRWDLEKLQAQG
jgi:hypothetical protein